MPRVWFPSWDTLYGVFPDVVPWLIPPYSVASRTS